MTLELSSVLLELRIIATAVIITSLYDTFMTAICVCKCLQTNLPGVTTHSTMASYFMQT